MKHRELWKLHSRHDRKPLKCCPQAHTIQRYNLAKELTTGQGSLIIQFTHALLTDWKCGIVLEEVKPEWVEKPKLELNCSGVRGPSGVMGRGQRA